MGRDYVTIKIDVERNASGDAVAKRLRGERRGGIPWMVILDADGKELVSSDAPSGNIGCPVQPEEVAWFAEMLRRSTTRLDDDDVAGIQAELEAYAKTLRR
ncbi:hypothetical protein N9293_00860 [Planctomycetota bacterium]|jgi:hypothetical protein|nr:hypothetical protein [bacterium]MDB4559426.1 hypothetical protein [Planctomycetota bacterium]